MANEDLKNIIKAIKPNYKQSTDRMRKEIATFFFTNHPSSPLASLKRCIVDNISNPETKSLGKNDPIIAYLKNIPDSEVEDLTRKLGCKKLRNHNNMRKWISQVFYQYDKENWLSNIR